MPAACSMESPPQPEYPASTARSSGFGARFCASRFAAVAIAAMFAAVRFEAVQNSGMSSTMGEFAASILRSIGARFCSITRSNMERLRATKSSR